MRAWIRTTAHLDRSTEKNLEGWMKKPKKMESKEALRIADEVLIALMKGNNLDINSIFEKDGSIKETIEKEAVYRINFCKDITKLAIPKLIKKLPEGVELDDERIENLASVFPLQYLNMFEQMKKGN